MSTKIVYYPIIIFIMVLSISCIVPYPKLSINYLSSTEQQIINDANESEHSVPTSADIIQVVNLNWFDCMNTIFTKYVKTRVIDIYSGKSYYVKRWGGYNHADVQALDAENLQIFKQIYGGEWSWVRRPVWVEIDGIFYCGSTNGMPHGFDLAEVGEGGHTCIHFLLSKTHGTKRVDPDHQACVQYAYDHRNEIAKYL